MSKTIEFVKGTKSASATGYYKPEILEKFGEALREAKTAVMSGEDRKVRISTGNRKMGDVPSFSTLPFITCPGRCADSCGKNCYAAKIANLYPAVRKAYAINTALMILDRENAFAQINGYLKAVRFFRFHVSGDIMDYDYFDRMVHCAVENPHCRILAFTKRFEIVNEWIDNNGDLPENLQIIFSAWKDNDPKYCGLNPHDLPESNIYTEADSLGGWWDLPETNDMICPGNCFSCACRNTGCWKLEKGATVYFKLH